MISSARRLSVRQVTTITGALGVVVMGMLMVLLMGSSADAAAAPAAPSAQFTTVPASRVLSTSTGVGASKAKLGAGKTITVQITGHGGVPTGATAVSANVVVSSGTATSKVTIYPAGATRPGTPTIYFSKSQSLANGATLALSSSGKLTVYNASGSVNVAIDVNGYYAPGTGSGDGELATKVDSLSAKVDALTSKLAADEATIASQKTLLSGISRVTVDSQPTLRFSGMNVQIVNGTDYESTVNGLGNLIVGYNTNYPQMPRTGSHDLVLGSNNGYTSFGSIVSGENNQALDNHAGVIGGEGNTASGVMSVILGATNSTTESDYASVTGGSANHAKGVSSSVSGGKGNTTTGDYSSISGGRDNQALYPNSSISGGRNNIAGGPDTWVGGGYLNAADGQYATVTGGSSNNANGFYASVTGGYLNEGIANYTTIIGGNHNVAKTGCAFLVASMNCTP